MILSRFLGQCYYLLNLHLFLAFILVPPVWTFFNVYYSVGFTVETLAWQQKGRMWNSDPKPKNECEPAGMQLSWTTKRIWDNLASPNPSFPLMLALIYRILSAGNILGRYKPGQHQFPCLGDAMTFLGRCHSHRGMPTIRKSRTYKTDQQVIIKGFRAVFP